MGLDRAQQVREQPDGDLEGGLGVAVHRSGNHATRGEAWTEGSQFRTLKASAEMRTDTLEALI